MNKKLYKNQTGSMLIMGLLMFVLVAIIAGTGWYVWHSKQAADKTLDAASKSAQSITSSPSKKKTSQPVPAALAPSTTQKYLTITEWGIKIKLTPDTLDAYYAIPDPTANPKYVDVSLKNLDNSGCSATNGVGVGHYFQFRAADKDPTSGKLLTEVYTPNQHLGNFYYAFEGNHFNCSGDANASAANAEADAALQAFALALTTLTTSP